MSKAAKKQKTYITLAIVIPLSVLALAGAIVALVLILRGDPVIAAYNDAWSQFEKASESFDESALSTLIKVDPESKSEEPYRKWAFYRECLGENNLPKTDYTDVNLERVQDFRGMTEDEIAEKTTLLKDAATALDNAKEMVSGCLSSFEQTKERISEIMMGRFSDLYNEYQTQVKYRSNELSAEYFGSFSQYKSRVGAFDNSQDSLKIEDLVKGTGKEIRHTKNGGKTDYYTDYVAYYIGWRSDGHIFDSSFNDSENPTSLISPLSGSIYLIEGWQDGIDGMRLGGVREVTIPSDLAYGDAEYDDIPANSTLKFIVMLIETPKQVPVTNEFDDLVLTYLGYSLRDNNE